jgi:hypothetical protein
MKNRVTISFSFSYAFVTIRFIAQQVLKAFLHEPLFAKALAKAIRQENHSLAPAI